jgi:hypothetical protein
MISSDTLGFLSKLLPLGFLSKYNSKGRTQEHTGKAKSEAQHREHLRSGVQRIQLRAAGDPRRGLGGIDAEHRRDAARDPELRGARAGRPRQHQAGRHPADLALRQHRGAEPVRHAPGRGQRRHALGRAPAPRRAGLQLPLDRLVRGEPAPVRAALDRVQDQHLLRAERGDEGPGGGARAVGGDGAVGRGEQGAGGVEVDADGVAGLQGEVGEEEGGVERRRGGQVAEQREGGGGDEDDEDARGRGGSVGGEDEAGGGLRRGSGEVMEVVGGEARRRRRGGDDVLHGACGGCVGGMDDPFLLGLLMGFSFFLGL